MHTTPVDLTRTDTAGFRLVVISGHCTLSVMAIVLLICIFLTSASASFAAIVIAGVIIGIGIIVVGISLPETKVG